MTIDLTAEEVGRLRDILLRSLNAVHWEIANSENEELRTELKEVRTFLDRVLAKLAPAHAEA